MKKVYIVLSYTGTILSRLIKMFSNQEYAHVSIALDENFEHMYSFGRLNPYNPFIGGFVQESPHYGTFKRFKRTEVKVYSLNVSDEDYARMQDTIKKFEKYRKKYRYNFMGILAVAGNYHLRRKNYYYCAEFVKCVLENTTMKLHLPEAITLNDFQNIKGLNEIYTGLLVHYRAE